MTTQRRKGSLRTRVVAAFTLLAVVVCVCFAVLASLLIEEVEHDVIEKRLQAIAQQYAAIPQAPEGLPPGLQLCAGDACAKPWRDLGPGFHERSVDDQMYYIYVQKRLGKTHLVVIDSFADLERIENEIPFGLTIGALLAIGLAVLLGRATAGWVIRPVAALAETVSHDELDEHTPALARNDEIGVLGRALAARTTALREALARERLFSGDVSHELRTPLTVMLGTIEILSHRLKEFPEHTVELQRMQKVAQELADRVSALLMLSRAPQRLDAPIVELEPLIERELEHCCPLLKGKAVELDFVKQGCASVHAHPELASMAIGNLLRNACLYTEEGHVKLLLQPEALIVEDSGPGLPEQIREHLFERYAPGGDPGGSGLGLALAKRITTHLGWELQYEIPENGGSRFVVTFPALS